MSTEPMSMKEILRVTASDGCYAHTEIEGAMPLSDPESEAIAAHTTPGKGEPTSIDIEAAIAEQAMRRLSARLAADLGAELINIVIGNAGCVCVTAKSGANYFSEAKDTLPEAIAGVRAKLTATRCACPACGRAGV